MPQPALLLLSFLFLYYSCNGQTKSNDFAAKVNEQEAKSQSEILDSLVKKGIDPYFVESRDTFSIHGPQCIVRDVLQDKNGNFWLASWQGIIKYDGNVFINYTLKEGLIRFHVLALFEDSKNNLWFSMVRGGVYRYDGKSFQLFTTSDGLANNTVLAFAEDKNGNIWFGTEKGLSSYNGKSFTSYTTKDGLIDNYVNSLVVDKTGKLWIGTAKGINHFDARLTDSVGQGKFFSEFKDKDGLSFKLVASLVEDRAGNIWIGSSAQQAGGKGLCRYDGKTLTELISPNFIMYIRQDRKGNLLLAHNDYPANRNFSLYRYDEKSFDKIIEQKEPSNNPAIFGMIEDRIENIWFGTAKGVCRYDGETFDYFY